MFLTSQLSKRLQNTSRQVTNLAFLDVAGRIAQALMHLAKQPEAMTHRMACRLKLLVRKLVEWWAVHVKP